MTPSLSSLRWEEWRLETGDLRSRCQHSWVLRRPFLQTAPVLDHYGVEERKRSLWSPLEWSYVSECSYCSHQNNWQEAAKFILAHSFQGFSLSQPGRHRGDHIASAFRKQRGGGQGYQVSGYIQSDLLRPDSWTANSINNDTRLLYSLKLSLLLGSLPTSSSNLTWLSRPRPPTWLILYTFLCSALVYLFSFVSALESPPTRFILPEYLYLCLSEFPPPIYCPGWTSALYYNQSASRSISDPLLDWL